MSLFEKLLITMAMIIFAAAVAMSMSSCDEEFPVDSYKLQLESIDNAIKNIQAEIVDINTQQKFSNQNEMILQTMNAHLRRCNVWCGRFKHVVNFTMDKEAIVHCECGR